MTEKEELAVLREKIDIMDYRIHDLLNQRAGLCLKVSEVKIKHGGPNVEFYRPERERVILDQVKAHNTGPLSDKAVSDIFETVIAECRTLQQRVYGTVEHVQVAFHVDVNELRQRVYVEDPVRIKFVDIPRLKQASLLGATGLELAEKGFTFVVDRALTKRLFELEVAKLVE